MARETSVEHIVEIYGFGVRSVSQLALIAADPARRPSERADALVRIGQIALHADTRFLIDGSVLPLYLCALRIDPQNIQALLAILLDYKWGPDAHTDTDLARRCYGVLSEMLPRLSEDDQWYFADMQRVLKQYGALSEQNEIV